MFPYFYHMKLQKVEILNMSNIIKTFLADFAKRPFFMLFYISYFVSLSKLSISIYVSPDLTF
jgi:hypothetical protein